MNTVVTSREAILQVCRALVSEQGLSALNMREVARRCQVALGSLYNYFPSKNDLTLAVIESVWRDIFAAMPLKNTSLTLPDYTAALFAAVRAGMQTYPHFFTAHSVSVANDNKGPARALMGRYLAAIQAGMAEALAQDAAVNPAAFGPSFTRDDFLGYVRESLLMLLMQQRPDCAVLVEMIRRAIY